MLYFWYKENEQMDKKVFLIKESIDRLSRTELVFCIFTFVEFCEHSMFYFVKYLVQEF